MASKESANAIYYISAQNTKVHLKEEGKYEHHVDGKVELITDVIKSDPYRKKFRERLMKDDDFRVKTLRWNKKTKEQYLQEWEARAKVGPKENIKHDQQEMISTMYELGERIEMVGDDKVKVKKRDGTTHNFKCGEGQSEVCPFDESHNGPAEELPDDVTDLKGFGEASLLLLMQRRLVEKMSIYTYVGDVVLCLNPYMGIPSMIDIQEYPNVKKYKLHSEPHSYGSAHFAYWGVVNPDPDSAHRDQSCIVSGESGAGKTVACGLIMRYLAKLSDWRKMEQGETVDPSAPDISKKVGGVSPFLEAFGNAKTNMNDNSSRFGKFTMIQIADGKVVGATMENYLLEKARLVDQGAGERNYHIFYFLIKGATKEEQALFKYKDAKEYDMLFHGHTTIIDNETDRETGANTYDTDRMNAPYIAGNPDNTGVRAAMRESGKIDDDVQMSLWKLVVGLMKMTELTFSAAKPDGSKVNEMDICAEVEDLLQIKDLAKNLVIFRRIIQGKPIDSQRNPHESMINRDALVKDCYGRIFDWLILEKCNEVLAPKGGSDGYVGLLDIFGFEVFKKNSVEQLCINFANEKLQFLFNEHIFEVERKTYDKEGLPKECIPNYQNNQPCVDLVQKGKAYRGILPYLDEFGKKESDTDQKYCAGLIKRWGRKENATGSAKKKKELLSAKNFRAKKVAGDDWFEIKHFAGWVKYHVEGWIEKNKDQLPVQLVSMMKASTHPLVEHYYNEKKHGKKAAKTLASKFNNQLASLADKLQSTTPHYVRCVKPNDIHFRPVDGRAAFDHWKTYRQLKFAGVMEVVKIKKEGYPFRMKFATFWKFCVDKGYAKAAPGVEESMDDKEGCDAIAKKWLPAMDAKGDRPFWVFGKTMLFGKQDTTEKLIQAHQACVSGLVQRWSRYNMYYMSYKDFVWAQRRIVSIWRNKLEMRRLAKIESQVIAAQAVVRAVKAREVLLQKQTTQGAVRLIQRTFLPFHLWKEWEEVRYRLGRIELVRANAVMVQKAYRNYAQYSNWASTTRAVICARAQVDLDVFVNTTVDRVSQDLARHNIGKRLVRRLRMLRALVRVQAHVRRANAAAVLREQQRRLAIVQQASHKAYGLFTMIPPRLRLRDIHQSAIKVQSCIRRRLGLPTQVWWMWTPDVPSFDGDERGGRRLRKGFARLRPHPGNVNAELERGWQALHRTSRVQNVDVKISSHAKILFGRGHSQTSVLIEKSRPHGPFKQLSHTQTALVYRVKVRRTFRQIRRAAIEVQRHVRGFLAYTRRCRIVGEARIVQKWYRMLNRRKVYMRSKNAALTIENKLFLAYLTKKRLKRWIEEMCSASMRGDVPDMRQLLFCDNPWERLAPLRSERIPVYGKGPLVDVPGLVNLRHPFYFTSFLHMATKSGSFNAVKLLLAEGAEVEACSAHKETPMHTSCANGDALLRISKLLYACSTYSQPGASRRWIISDSAITDSGDTVYDVAMDCFGPKQQTLEWLRDIRAASSMDPEEMLRQEQMRQQYKEAQERKMEAFAAEVEQKERDSDKLYQYLMLESSDTQKELQRTEAMRKRYLQYRSEEFQDEFRAKIVLGDAGENGAESESSRSLLHSLNAAAEAASDSKSSSDRVSPLKSSPLKPRGASATTASPPSNRLSPMRRELTEEEIHAKRATEDATMRRLKAMRSRLKLRTVMRKKRRQEFARQQRDEAYKQFHERRRAYAIQERDKAYRTARGDQGDDNDDGGGDAAERKMPGGVVAVDGEDVDPVEVGDEAEWRPAFDRKSGKPYYYNVRTRETSWTRPRSARSSPRDTPASGRKGSYIPLSEIRSTSGAGTPTGDDITGGGDLVLSTQKQLEREVELNRSLRSKLDFLESQDVKKQMAKTESSGHLKMALIRSLVALGEASDRRDRGWWYRDQNGRVQGPFDSQKMSKWYREGYIADDLLLRWGSRGPFRPMEEIFAGSGAANPFQFHGKQDLRVVLDGINARLENLGVPRHHASHRLL